MLTFDIETEEIAVFKIGDRPVFNTYVDEDQLFKQLEKYYNEDEYRFEIPDGILGQVIQEVEKYYYELEVVDSIEDYCIIVDRRLKSVNTLSSSVMRKQRGQREIHVMKDELSKKENNREGRCQPGKIRGRKGEIRMETSLTVAESGVEAPANRGNYKWFPLGNSNKGL